MSQAYRVPSWLEQSNAPGVDPKIESPKHVAPFIDYCLPSGRMAGPPPLRRGPSGGRNRAMRVKTSRFFIPQAVRPVTRLGEVGAVRFPLRI